MLSTKTLLLGTAAALGMAGAAAAADLPVRKAAPVEYVRICTAYGAGFFYIPGTDTCLRVGGRARFEYTYVPTLNRSGANGDVSGYRTLGRLALDARTESAYGTIRTFVRVDIASRSGAYLTSGSQQRLANAFPALGQDTFGRLQKFVELDKAFVQFAGFTAGRAASLFDFYAHDFELISATGGSDIQATNLMAYTATFGQGFQATISMEDPTFRRQPIFSNTGTALSQTAFNAFTAANAVSPVIVAGGLAPTVLGFEDVTQKNRMPDFVGALRYDAAWGSAQVSAAVHEINGGSIGALTTAAGVALPAGTLAFGRAPNEYGWAVQGGIKINTPWIAPGDKLYLQGAYGEGAMAYTGYQNYTATEIVSAAPFSGANFVQYLPDAVLNPITGRYDLSKSFTVVGAYLHYWAPEWRSAVFASYGEVSFSKSARAGLGIVGFGLPGLVGTGVAGQNAFNTSPVLRDNNQLVAGASLIWSPVRDLDVGVEGVYVRTALNNGVTNDLNKNPNLFAVNGIPVRTVRESDIGQIRFRVQRDF